MESPCRFNSTTSRETTTTFNDKEQRGDLILKLHSIFTLFFLFFIFLLAFNPSFPVLKMTLLVESLLYYFSVIFFLFFYLLIPFPFLSFLCFDFSCAFRPCTFIWLKVVDAILSIHSRLKTFMWFLVIWKRFR